MRKALILLSWALSALAPAVASAEPGRAALVIGNGAYQGGPPLSACSETAHAVGTWLRQRGFDVEEALDASSVAMRSAIGNFVALASGSPQKTAIVYVCTYAAVSNQRLFMLPVDSDPRQPTRLETQGVIVKALLNTLAGTNGVLFADFDMAPDKSAADAVDALQADLPPGVHFAFVARNDAGIGSLGRDLPGLLAGAGQEWGRLAAEFQAQQGSSRSDRLAVFAPQQGPMPPAQDTGGPASVTPPAAVAAAPPAPERAEEPQPVAKAAGSSDQPAEVQAAEPETAAAEPEPQPPASPETLKAPAGAPLQLVPPPRPVEAVPQVADIAGADQQGPTLPEAPAPHVDAAATSQAAPAPAVHATQPASRPTDSRTGRIQAALARRGFYSGPVTGRSDSRTREAVRAFQSSLGDPPNGILTQIQIAKLLNLGR